MGNSLFKCCFGSTQGASTRSPEYQNVPVTSNTIIGVNHSSTIPRQQYFHPVQAGTSTGISAAAGPLFQHSSSRPQNRTNIENSPPAYNDLPSVSAPYNGSQTQTHNAPAFTIAPRNHAPTTVVSINSPQNQNLKVPPSFLQTVTPSNQQPISNIAKSTTTLDNGKSRVLVRTSPSVLVRPKVSLASTHNTPLHNKRLVRPATRTPSIKSTSSYADTTTAANRTDKNDNHSRLAYNMALNALSTISSVPFPDLKTWLNSALIITPSSQEHEYKVITEYVNNGQAHSYGVKILSIIRICQRSVTEFRNREGFNPKVKRMMLWHGTKQKNVSSILKDGLRLPNSGRGLMQGSGIYFADRVTKSANYSAECTCSKVTHSCNSEGILLLCDVLLGRTKVLPEPNHDLTSAPEGFDSVKCPGKSMPNYTGNYRLYGSCVPKGETVPNTQHPNNRLLFNEYTVYDPDRINIKFIVHFQFNSSCYKNV